MAGRAPLALAMPLACALATTLLACASSTPTTASDPAAGDPDAAPVVEPGEGGDASLPPPDALVLADADLPDSDPDAAEAAPPPPGSCVGKPDGAVCVASPDPCHTDATCSGGLCGGLGTRGDGYNWASGDATAICCNGTPIHADTSSDCGACGIACNAGNGESCELLGGHYFCRGCAASAGCWSKCCSTTFTPYTCSASDCAGNCNDAICPKGSHCVSGLPNSSDYCAY